MKIHELICEQKIKKPLAQVFAFFQDPCNLALITPPWLDFKITTPAPIIMKKGLRIDYTLRPMLGLKMRWTSIISEYEPPYRFVDEQAKGPYAYWHHTHRFQELATQETLVCDHVRYGLPLGWIGQVAHALYVKQDLEKIFNYRRAVIETQLA